MKRIALFLFNTAMFFGVFAQYPYIKIADVTVTPDNQENITSDYISGTVRYDSASRTLLLQNAVIYSYQSSDPDDFDNGRTISIEAHSGQTVNIELIGQNAVFGQIPLTLHSGSYDITGGGSLLLEGVFRGILCELGVDTFRISQGTSVNIAIPYAQSVGFEGSAQYQDYPRTVLSIDSALLNIHADICVQSIVGFQLLGSHIVSPVGAYYDPTSMTLMTAGGIVRNYLEVRPGTVGVPTHTKTGWRAWGMEGGIRIDNILENSSVEVINTQGQVVFKAATSDTDTFVPMRSGVYVVRVNKSSSKVVVK